ncbi:hypothetical protein [Lysinibacillus fusiformis]|uniref:hypothetical protein n=1 Tax=Lysinibacillus fusiformis TaxID=28031 RepID=UPI003D04CAE7
MMPVQNSASYEEVITFLNGLTGINQKSEIVAAINNKGVSASQSDSMATLANKILQIKTGKQKATGKAYPVTGGCITVDSLTFKPGLVVFYLSGASNLTVDVINPYMVVAIDQAIPLQHVTNDYNRNGKNLVMTARKDNQGSTYDHRLNFQPTTYEFKNNGVWEKISNFEARNNGFYLRTQGGYLSENIEHTWIAYEL